MSDKPTLDDIREAVLDARGPWPGDDTTWDDYYEKIALHIAEKLGIPPRPAWEGAQVIHAPGLLSSNNHLLRWGGLGHYRTAGGRQLEPGEVADMGPITVVIDADGNPPTLEQEWLDAEALEKLPHTALVLSKEHPSDPFRRAAPAGFNALWFSALGYGPPAGLTSASIAPARLLWAPEGDR